tara:strand:- start:4322 stop:4966 length:645 start_codon:yes stop_codon:yes gene_type:complete
VKLYSFYISSAAYRARIALNLKGLAYEYIAIDMFAEEHLSSEYGEINPQGLVPVLVDGEHTLSQTLAIMEYLEEVYPEPPLLPDDPVERARVRALALVPDCEMHPINNRRIREYLVNDLELGQETMIEWIGHWNARGFATLEALLSESPHTGVFCHGDRLTVADVFLVPQLDAARRFETDLSPYPTALRIEEACLALPEFQAASPGNQPDAPQG